MKLAPKQIKQYALIAGAIAGTIILIKQAKNILTKIKANRDKNLLQTSVTGTNTAGETVVIDLGSTAAEIYDAFYNNDWFGYSEDEERAIAALISVPDEYIEKLGTLYFKLYGNILKADFVSYLSSEEYLQIKDKFL